MVRNFLVTFSALYSESFKHFLQLQFLPILVYLEGVFAMTV